MGTKPTKVDNLAWLRTMCRPFVCGFTVTLGRNNSPNRANVGTTVYISFTSTRRQIVTICLTKPLGAIRVSKFHPTERAELYLVPEPKCIRALFISSELCSIYRRDSRYGIGRQRRDLKQRRYRRYQHRNGPASNNKEQRGWTLPLTFSANG